MACGMTYFPSLMCSATRRGEKDVMAGIVCSDAHGPALLQVVTEIHPLTGCELGLLLRVLPAPLQQRWVWTVFLMSRPEPMSVSALSS